MRKISALLLGLFSSCTFAASTTAAHATVGPLGKLGSFLPLIIIVVLFYFLLIRPQMKRSKDHKNLMGKLQVGDEIMTTGGIIGKITKVEDNFIKVSISDKVEIKIQRNAIANVMPKGTFGA